MLYGLASEEWRIVDSKVLQWMGRLRQSWSTIANGALTVLYIPDKSLAGRLYKNALCDVEIVGALAFLSRLLSQLESYPCIIRASRQDVVRKA